VTDFATNIARDDQSWTWILRIDGLGPALSGAELAAADSDGRYRFCTAIPDYAASMPSSVWQDLLTEIPAPLRERVTDLGGATELGSLTIELLDGDDLLTQEIRTERPPLTRLSQTIDTNDTSVGVDSTTGLSADDNVWNGAEAMRITVVGGSSITVQRGALNTDPTVHDEDSEVYQSINFLRGRRAYLHIAPIDGDSSADEEELGAWVIDSLEWSEDLNRWVLLASSQLKPLARQIPLQPRRMRAEAVNGDPSNDAEVILSIPPQTRASDLRLWTTNTTPDVFYVRHESGEVMTLTGDANGFVGTRLRTYRRDLLRTGRAELKADEVFHQVFMAEPSAPGSFRYSPGPSPSTSRTSGTWTPVAHFIPVMAILLTSSAREGDGLELTNYVAARGNFASLPPGFGVGYPAGNIDWDSWFDVWNRTPDYLFPYFVFGDEAVEFGELVTHNFLRPMGAYFITSAGLAKIVLPRLPLIGSAVLTIGEANILKRPVGGRRQYLPRVSVRRDRASQASAIRYIVGPNTKAPVTFHSAEFGATFGQGGYYGTDEKPIDIHVPAGDPDTPEIYARRGLSRLWRTRRPRIEVDGDFDASVWSGLPLGDVGELTLAELPNLAAGLRGWDSVLVQHLEAEPRGQEGAGGGFYTNSRMLGYGPDVRIGRVAPSAHIVEVSDGVIAIVTTNRYTHTDAQSPLPTNDAAGFHVDDVVRILNLDGTDAGGGATETVVSVAGDDIELSGDFGGLMAAGQVLDYANYDDADPQQTSRYAFMSDATNLTPGSSNDDAWLYGEP
jgi:hypothetical protein